MIYQFFTEEIRDNFIKMDNNGVGLAWEFSPYSVPWSFIFDREDYELNEFVITFLKRCCDIFLQGKYDPTFTMTDELCVLQEGITYPETDVMNEAVKGHESFTNYDTSDSYISYIESDKNEARYFYILG